MGMMMVMILMGMMGMKCLMRGNVNKAPHKKGRCRRILLTNQQESFVRICGLNKNCNRESHNSFHEGGGHMRAGAGIWGWTASRPYGPFVR